MKLMRMNIVQLFMALIISMTFYGCNNDDNESPMTKGSASIEMTDAPIDNSEISGAFVTVSEVKVDGKTFNGFNGKQTFDLMTLQNGKTKVLGNGELDARSYSTITFVLDYDTDANGNAPGCYILKTNGEKQRLESSVGSTGELTVNSSYKVEGSSQSRIIADFDLRKAIKHSDDADRDFEFVSDNELNSAVRVMNNNTTGSIKGNYSESLSNSTGKVVVFAYHKGEFNETTETSPGGEANVRFRNAVNSAVVSGAGNYELSFLKEGDYELHFASFKDTDQDGQYTFEAMLSSETEVDGNIMDFITVESSVEIFVSTTITGIIN